MIWWFGLLCLRIGSVHLSMKIKGSDIIRAPGPRVPQTILAIIFKNFVVWIIIWNGWIWLFTVGNARGIVYPKGPGTPGPSNHISYYILWIWWLGLSFGKLEFVC